MIELISTVWRHLGHKRRLQLATVSLLMVAGAFGEVFTLGAIVPFLGLLASPEVVDKTPWFAHLLDAVAGFIGGTRLLAASLLFGCIAVTAGALRLLLTWISNRVIFAIGTDLGEQVFNRVLHQPYAYHRARSSSQTR